jgi:hypothetical protein
LAPKKPLKEEKTMKKRTVVRVQQICGVLLFLASITAVAQDNASQTSLVNDAIYRGATKPPNPLGCVGFYDNICGAGYNGTIGWKVTDHSPTSEYSPAMQFTAAMTGTSSKITVGVGYVNGANLLVAVLAEDCAGAPCTTPDGTPTNDRLCISKAGKMPKFGSTDTITVSLPCQAPLSRGKKYWVILQAQANSGLAWNLSNSATGAVYDGVLDSWVNLGTRHLGALTVQ